MGRNTKFESRFIEEAQEACEGGATDADLARLFDVHVSTIYTWMNVYPEFREATKMGKEPADDRVERSLYMRALGFEIGSEKVFHKDGEIIRAEVIEYYPPDTTAGIFWLKNRRPHLWRDTAMRDDSDANDVRIHGGLPAKKSDDNA